MSSWQQLSKLLPSAPVRKNWKNIGGLLITENSLQSLIRSIRSGKIEGWDGVHEFYKAQGKKYEAEKTQHAWACLLEVLNLSPKKFTKKIFVQLLQQAIATNQWMTKAIHDSRAKDYNNPYRQMVYDTKEEMEKVIGKLEHNAFILSQQTASTLFEQKVNDIINRI